MLLEYRRYKCTWYKLDDHFLSKKYKEIQEFDVVILAETHIGYDIPVFIEHFTYFPVCRDVSSNGRYYGGLAIYKKEGIERTCKDYQWIKFDKKYFNL